MAKLWETYNNWWRATAKLLSRAQDKKNANWNEANAQLWEFTWLIPGGAELQPEDRADLVQEMMVRLQKADFVSKLANAATPAHYLTKTMENQLKNEQRHRRVAKRHARRVARNVETDQDQHPGQLAAWQEQQDKLTWALSQLPANDRQVLRSYYWDGLSATAIANHWNCRPSAVWKRLARAKKRLKQVLTRD